MVFLKFKKRGVVFLELLWFLLLIIGFLSSFTYLYNKSQKQIEKHRIGRIVKHDQWGLFIH